MQLPNENASTEELRRFAAGLSSERRMRLAAALIYPEIEEIANNDDDLTDDAETAGQVFAGEFEPSTGIGSAFGAFFAFVYMEI